MQACSPTRRVALPRGTPRTAQVATLAGRAGVTLLPWQQSVLDDWTATDPGTGRLVHSVCGLAVPRQNGKSVSAQWWVLVRAMVDGYRVLWTEHNYSTTCEMINRFKAVCGTSIYAFTKQQKMYAAAELLRTGDSTVLEIAGRFGYDNASKFAGAFRNVMGVTPNEYRSKLRSR